MLNLHVRHIEVTNVPRGTFKIYIMSTKGNRGNMLPTVVSGSFSELSPVCVGDNKFEYKNMDVDTYVSAHPVAIIETDLQAIFDAGLNPQAVPVSHLLDKTDPLFKQNIAEGVLCKFADSISRQEEENLNANNSQNNNNTNANE